MRSMKTQMISSFQTQNSALLGIHTQRGASPTSLIVIVRTLRIAFALIELLALLQFIATEALTTEFHPGNLEISLGAVFGAVSRCPTSAPRVESTDTAVRVEIRVATLINPASTIADFDGGRLAAGRAASI